MDRQTDPTSRGIADAVRAEAARAHMDINNLASVIGRSQSYTYERLAGRKAFNTEDLSKIATALHMPLTMLFDSYMLGERIRAHEEHTEAA
ncbi:helix-turn-helix domain-containing protein [Bifidobacterium choerinum]|nr:helix-turn-helix domain-containing protein [Bifidobacterium choerinum]